MRVKKVELNFLGELRQIQCKIDLWFDEECSKAILQARSDECSYNEKVSIYHHDLLKKLTTRSSILKLETN